MTTPTDYHLRVPPELRAALRERGPAWVRDVLTAAVRHVSPGAELDAVWSYQRGDLTVESLGRASSSTIFFPSSFSMRRRIRAKKVPSFTSQE